MTFALIPAGGKSMRMGQPKLCLPLGERTILEWVVHAFRGADVSPILVVVPPHLPELGNLAQSAGTEVVRLKNETPDMRATVEAGLRYAEERLVPQPEDDWFLAPADHPTLEIGVVRTLLAQRRQRPEYSVFVPTYEARRGHPTLIRWQHVHALCEFRRDLGINSYLRSQMELTLEVAVESAEILRDLDTIDDYNQLLAWWNQR